MLRAACTCLIKRAFYFCVRSTRLSIWPPRPQHSPRSFCSCQSARPTRMRLRSLFAAAFCQRIAFPMSCWPQLYYVLLVLIFIYFKCAVCLKYRYWHSNLLKKYIYLCSQLNNWPTLPIKIPSQHIKYKMGFINMLQSMKIDKDICHRPWIG